jgi:uncharacterized protein YuzE
MEPSDIHCTVSVDEHADALYIQLTPVIAHAESVVNESHPMKSRPSELVLDFNAAGQLLGIEIIGIKGLLKPPPEKDPAPHAAAPIPD